VRISLTRLSLSALALLAVLAFALAALVFRGPSRPVSASGPAAAAAGQPSTAVLPGGRHPVSLSPPAAGSGGTVILTAYRAPSRVAVARSIARSMVASRHWSVGQYSCLVRLWNRESGWNVYAANPSSGAYGIPQALPGRKMASAGPNWRTSARTQIKWGLGYIKGRYGTPCRAWAHSNAYGWY
jgi:hypothetical protein